jgi:hypothetical protein
MAGSIESNQDTSCGQIRKTPVPAIGCAGAVIGGHEGFVSSAESPGLGSADGKPDEVQDEVEHDEAGGDPEDILEVTSYSRGLVIVKARIWEI